MRPLLKAQDRAGERVRMDQPVCAAPEGEEVGVPLPERTPRIHALPSEEGASPTGRQMLRAAASVGAMRLFAMLVSFLTGILLARWLGVTGYGNYVYAVSWVSLLSVLGVAGLDRLGVRNTAVYHVQAGWPLLAGMVRWANGVSLLATAAFLLIAAALWTAFPARITGSLAGVAPLAALLVPLLVLTRVQQAVLRGLGRVKTSQAPELVVIPGVQLLGIVAVGAMTAWSLSTSQAFAIYLMAAVIGLAGAAAMVNRAMPAEARSASAAYQPGSWISSAVPLLLVSAITTANGQVDVLMLEALRNARAVSLYSAADQVTRLIALPLEVSSIVLATTFARMHAVGDHGRLQHLLTRSTRGILLAATVLTALLVLGSPLFLGLYGPAFTHSQDVLVLLSGGQWLTAALGPVALLLIMTGHEREVTAGTAVALVMNVALNLWLIPLWGAAGAAAAVSISVSLRSALLGWLVWRRLRLRASPL